MANEKRLIDADALLELVQFTMPINNRNAEIIARCVDATRELIEAQPTIDAVEVVRCKDCKFKEDCMKQIEHWGRDHVLEQNIYEYKKIDFCSYGERKEECD